jgi:hypothetical protein
MLTNLPPSVNRLSIENVGASTSHNPMGLHCLLQGWLYHYLYLFKWSHKNLGLIRHHSTVLIVTGSLNTQPITNYWSWTHNHHHNHHPRIRNIRAEVDSKGFWRWYITLRITGFSNFVHRKVLENYNIGRWIKSENPVILRRAELHTPLVIIVKLIMNFVTSRRVLPDILGPRIRFVN